MCSSERYNTNLGSFYFLNSLDKDLHQLEQTDVKKDLAKFKLSMGKWQKLYNGNGN